MTLIRRKIGQKDYHKVLDIWEKSVISTHDFLKEKDRLELKTCLLYTSPSPRDGLLSRMPSSA